ncbi:MAG TPA: hypothetical protein VLB79_03720 [Solirubrobacterales bacterium]|nr:hypothetical protein [Solirubrobacterales bacterium]
MTRLRSEPPFLTVIAGVIIVIAGVITVIAGVIIVRRGVPVGVDGVSPASFSSGVARQE